MRVDACNLPEDGPCSNGISGWEAKWSLRGQRAQGTSEFRPVPWKQWGTPWNWVCPFPESGTDTAPIIAGERPRAGGRSVCIRWGTDTRRGCQASWPNRHVNQGRSLRLGWQGCPEKFWKPWTSVGQGWFFTEVHQPPPSTLSWTWSLMDLGLLLAKRAGPLPLSHLCVYKSV